MDKERICAITDGIVAIAATIMVLELNIPTKVTILSLLNEWNIIIAYIISFILIYLSWYAHHTLVKTITNISSKFFLINGLWLFFITLVPFVTGLIGEDINNSIAMFTYVIVNFFLALSFQLLSYQGKKDNPKESEKILLSKKYVISIIIINIISIGFSFIYPIISLIIGVLISTYLSIDLIRKS